MNIEQQIQQLSQMAGISAADARCVCQGIVNSMIDDGFRAEHLEQNESAQIEIVGAYMENQAKKAAEFTQAYFGMNGAREAFAEFMLADLRGAA